jgi:hypothetical protein
MTNPSNAKIGVRLCPGRFCRIQAKVVLNHPIVNGFANQETTLRLR